MKQNFKVKPLWLEATKEFSSRGPTVDDSRNARISTGRTEPNDDNTYDTSFTININDKQVICSHATGYRSFYPKYDVIQLRSLFSREDIRQSDRIITTPPQQISNELGFKDTYELIVYLASGIFIDRKGGGAEQGTVIGISLDVMREFKIPIPQSYELDPLSGILLWDNAINLRASS